MHAYKEGVKGRSLHSNPLDSVRYARVDCSSCGFTGKQKIKSLMPPEQLDNKFQRTGWELDPNLCPTCISKRRFERRLKTFAVIPEGISPLPGIADTQTSNLALAAPMAQEVEPLEVKLVAVLKAPPEKKPKLRPVFTRPEPKPEAKPVAPPPAPPRNPPMTTIPSKQETPMTTPLADNDVLRAVSKETHKATAKMHILLGEHFSEDEGKYAMGWTDERIANETGLSEVHVCEVRDAAYGPLKEPDAFLACRSDLKALHELFIEMMAAADKKHDEEIDKIKTEMQKEVNGILERLTDAAKALGFKF